MKNVTWWDEVMADWGLESMVDAIQGSTDKAYHSQEGVDRLSNLLAQFDSSNPTYPRGVRCLRRMCRETNLVPTACILSTQVILSNTATCKSNFSDVWKGSLNGREVAVKVLRLHGDELLHVKQAYLHELVVWQCLRHPNIVPFIGAPQLHEVSFVSEWMSGGTITVFLLKHPDHDRAELVADITAGVEFMHALDVVHGDIKTENVLIDSQCRARLTDFGLATILHATATTATAGRGTVRYMAPELLDWEASNSTGRASKASDMYALAITIWRIYSEAIPFSETRSDVAVARRVLNQERPQRTAEMDGRGMTDQLWAQVTCWWSQDPSLRLSPIGSLALFPGDLLSMFMPRAPRPRSPLLVLPPFVECDGSIHILLFCNAVGKPKWSWDVSYPPDMVMVWGKDSDFQSLLGQAATTPSLSKIVLRCGDLDFPYDVSVLPSKESPPPPTISVQDVLYSLYGNLRTPLAPKEYSILSSDSQKALATAYNTRVHRIVDPTRRETERRKGLKRIDHLIAAGRTYFIGLTATNESNDTFIAHFASKPYVPGRARAQAIKPYVPGWTYEHFHPIVF